MAVNKIMKALKNRPIPAMWDVSIFKMKRTWSRLFIPITARKKQSGKFTAI